MEEYTQIKRVTFSGKFQLVLTDEDVEYARVIVVDTQVSRFAESPYFSNRTYPENGFLATVTFVNENFVYERRDIEYENQRIYLDGGNDQQDIPTQVCLGTIAAQNLQILATALGTSVTIGESAYAAALTPTRLFPQNLQFQCYAGTALTVTVSKLRYEQCDGLTDPPPPPPKPRIPPPPPFFNPREPIPREIYARNEAPEDTFKPFPGDEPPDQLPTGEECMPYRVLGTLFDVNGVGTESQVVDIIVLGKVEDIFSVDNAEDPFIFRAWFIKCGGVQGETECIQGTDVEFFDRVSPESFFELDSVLPV